jgi:thiol:disulfide interchange protein/DsbC/DsbD-like thiol-disulfide interchange protein
MIRKRLAFAASFILFASLQIAAQIAPTTQKIVKTPHVEAELIARHQSFIPGQPIEVALRLNIIDHWHTYWRNPGDSGLPTKLKWTLPAGYSAGEIQWPHPKKLPLGPLMNYGYEGEVLHLVSIKTPANIKPGELATFTAKADWLVCADVCIPEEGVLTFSLPAVASAPLPDARWAKAFSVAEAALPSAMLSNVGAQIDGLTLRLSAKTNALGGINNITFYPYRDDVVANAAKQTFSKTADGFHLDVMLAEPISQEKADNLKTLDGIFVANNAAWGAPINAKAVTIAAPVTYGAGLANNVSASTSGQIEAKLPENAQPALSLLTAIVFAFLGGLVLNLMPCVFPVLGIKVMGFVENAHGNAQLLRRQGIAFFIGVMLSFLLLAGLMLVLRAAGQSIGWGFQLQEPLFVAGLAILFFAMALNLSGVFEIGTSLQSAAGNAELSAQKSPLGGAFASGVLATVVATPCMAPGLGASVGFTLGQSAPVALLVFMAIAVGLALPVVMLAFFPALLRYLPKPGAWMETFKQFMAFPLYATVVWLAWVLGSQTGNDGVMLLLVGLTTIALAAWIYGRWQIAKPAVAALAGVAVTAVGIAAAWAGATTVPPTTASAHSVSADGWIPYSADKIAQLRGEGKAVFVDFTATWCITCQVNKRVALNQDSVVKKMAEANVVRMKADWTRKDEAITKALAAFGRNGVPLYVLYPAKGEAEILPEVLTPSIVIAAVDKLVVQK